MNENDEKIIGAKEGDKIKAESESCRRFLAIAEKYMMLRICALVSLVAFVFGVLIFGHSSLKSENFKYLVKSSPVSIIFIMPRMRSSTYWKLRVCRPFP